MSKSGKRIITDDFIEENTKIIDGVEEIGDDDDDEYDETGTSRDKNSEYGEDDDDDNEEGDDEVEGYEGRDEWDWL